MSNKLKYINVINEEYALNLPTNLIELIHLLDDKLNEIPHEYQDSAKNRI